MRIRSQIQTSFRELYAKVDILISPTRFHSPELVAQPFDVQDKSLSPPPSQKGVGAGLVQASNLCGLPALSVPCGFVNGLPIGLQFVGPAFSENTLLSFGREFQRLTDFHKQRPPVEA
jgi:aspartyl-tRNA(Asn)/glutamyl-tRNA(Gln) amidotransferase subunit A